MKSIAYDQTSVGEAARIFAQTEGIITAPETAHAIRYVIDAALECKKTGEKKVIAFNNSGHGLLDLTFYEELIEGKLVDWEPTKIIIPEYVKNQS
jgi:tryptophan synthase beta chain